MYCSSCGIESIEGTRYCKRCGANVSGAVEAPVLKRFPIALTIAFLVFIGGIFTLGLGLPMAAASDLTRNGLSPRDLMFLFVADMGVTLTVVGMLIWLLLRLIGVYQGAEHLPRTATLSKAVRIPLIGAPPEALGSVTENTTRTLRRTEEDAPHFFGDAGKRLE